jgi:hypothetical protein
LPPASPSVVGYFYINFGPSMRFPKGRDTASGDTPKAFETIPELSDTVPYNPFIQGQHLSAWADDGQGDQGMFSSSFGLDCSTPTRISP